jgi:hypothetical protein
MGKGKRGGTVIYAETFGRRNFTPTHFIDMVGRGWVGTSALQTDALAPYLKAMLAGKKAVVLAVESSNPASLDPDSDDEEGLARRTVVPGKPRYPGKKPKIIEV